MHCIPMFVGHKRWIPPRQTLPKTFGRSSSRARVTVTIHFTMSMDTSDTRVPEELNPMSESADELVGLG